MKGITFNNIHSYNDLNLILSKSEITPAVPKTTLIEVPGADGAIDLTEALGEVKFGNRSCSFTFTMNPMGGLSDSDFELKKTEISNKLNGVACQIVFDTDPNFYYEGRVAVDDYISDRRLRQFVISGSVKPYKLKKEETVVSKSLASTAKEMVITNGRKTVIPTIEVSASAKVVFEGNTYNLAKGTHRNMEIQLKEGNNVFNVSGSGTIKFTYREGEL